MITILWETEGYEDKIGVPFQETVQQIAEYSMQTEGFYGEYEVSITVTDDASIREMNCNFRNIDKVTDVLSFPMYEREELQEIEESQGYSDYEVSIGDVVLSYDTAVEQAKEYGHTLERELCFLVVHSIFHLLGYDHMEEEERRVMRAKEEGVLSHFKIYR